MPLYLFDLNQFHYLRLELKKKIERNITLKNQTSIPSLLLKSQITYKNRRFCIICFPV